MSGSIIFYVPTLNLSIIFYVPTLNLMREPNLPKVS